MKKIFLTTVFLFSLIISSCSSDDVNVIEPATTSNLSLTSRISAESYFNNYNFEIIGTEHNHGLDAIYLQLAGLDIQKLDENQINSLIFQETNRYITENRNFLGFNEELLELIKPDTNDSNNEEFNANLERELSKNFSSTFIIEKFDDINKIFNNYATIENYTSSNAINELKKIQNSIETTEIRIEEKEFVAINAVISTGIASLVYWESNLPKWEALNTVPSITTHRDWGWFKGAVKNMAVADAYGAGVGAVVGFVSSVATGPGVVVGTAAGAVGYGMNSSAVAGVRELFR